MQSVLHLGRVGHLSYEIFDLLELLIAPTLKTPRVMNDQIRTIRTNDRVLDVMNPSCAF